jgi:RNA polymerase sigma-70 factor (ECF subfamily)
MSETSALTDLVRRLRAGDPQAAEELVRQYEPAVRLAVRVRLRDPRLRRVFDTLDICQSALGSFFARAARGQYDLEQPGQLIKLLVAIAHNKLAYHIRKQRAQRRDFRRVEPLERDHEEALAVDGCPGQQCEERDLVTAYRARLSPQEREVADLRAQGLEWADIAIRLGGTAEGRRKQLTRASARVARELRLEPGQLP